MADGRPWHLSGEDEFARWMAALADARSRTLERVSGLSDADLERGEPNTIGSVLYHVAAIEADYLFDDILGEPDGLPVKLFPHDVRERGGVLTPVTGMRLREHLDRLAAVRTLLVERVGPTRFLDKVARASYDISPVYAIYHLTQHEAEHRAEIGRALAP